VIERVADPIHSAEISCYSKRGEARVYGTSRKADGRRRDWGALPIYL